MVGNQDKRKHQRFDARVEVQFANGAEFKTAYSKNISKGGIFLETEDLPDPNAMIELVFDLRSLLQDAPDSQITLKGRVVRLMTVVVDAEPVHKIAVQFVDVPTAIQLQLDRLYESLSQP